MSADSGKEGLLVKLEEILSEGLRRVQTVVKEVLGWNLTGISTHQFEGLLGLEHFRRTESSLQLDVDVS
jgi:hypothetical protein